MKDDEVRLSYWRGLAVEDAAKSYISGQPETYADGRPRPTSLTASREFLGLKSKGTRTIPMRTLCQLVIDSVVVATGGTSDSRKRASQSRN